MSNEIYRVSGWVTRHSGHRPYWAEFGYYQTLDAAHKAANAVAGPATIISITTDGRTLATYCDGVLMDNVVEEASLLNRLLYGTPAPPSQSTQSSPVMLPPRARGQ